MQVLSCLNKESLLLVKKYFLMYTSIVTQRVCSILKVVRVSFSDTDELNISQSINEENIVKNFIALL